MNHLMPFETRPCRVCGEKSVLIVPEVSVRDWRGGTLIQDAFPFLSVDDRELMISGTHPACWQALWDGY